MNEYTASNGIGVRVDHVGDLDFKSRLGWAGLAGGKVVDALREFFRAEEDERLGRWRWPENPDYVVYATNVPSRVRVLRETGVGDLEWVDRGDERAYEFCHAARAFFDAHPEPRPWHDAKDGETWALTVNGAESAWAFRLQEWERIYDGVILRGAPNSPAITAGRRIWPEEDS